MTGQPPPDDVRALWQEQPTEPLAMPVNEIREKAAKFEKKVNRRNRREYFAAAYVVTAAAVYVVMGSNPVVKIACGLMIAGALFVVYHLHSRASARTLPFHVSFEKCLDFYRSELVRQRDLLRSVWWWYIGPLVPGLVVFGWEIADVRSDRMRGDWWIAIMTLMLVSVLGLNWWGARKLQRQIDELDSLRNDR
ncbi:MAG: hypothetical protein O2968_20120 [Acidobacteria bacterium]|nr:hypothetical protein [Acidobacteriota bacterium]